MQVKNYRPISLLSNTSKVLERIIYNKIIHHISCQINPSQFGFMQNCSTTKQLLLFLSAAFTTHNQLWIWFKEYLTNRSQFVTINNTQLYLLPVLSGVPQDNILGPFLFILYMIDLPDAIHWSKALLFANDTKCFMRIKSPVDPQHLQLDLDNLASWNISSHLSFNSSKSAPVSLNNRTPTSYVTRFTV